MITYGLVDPRDGKIKYIGSTRRDPNFRLYQHISQACYDPIYGEPDEGWKDGWVAAVSLSGLKLALVKLADGNFERVIFKALKASGVELYNKSTPPQRLFLTYAPTQERNPQ